MKIKNNSLGHSYYYDDQIQFGKNVTVYSNCHIAFPNIDSTWFDTDSDKITVIGDNTLIYPGCIVYKGAKIGRRVIIEEYSTIGSCSSIGDGSIIVYRSQIYHNVKIGKGSIVGGFCANNCTIGDNVVVMGSLVHKFTTLENKSKRIVIKDWQEINEDGPRIANDVFIGLGSVIIGPINIGEGAKIAAGSIITKDVPKGSMIIQKRLRNE